MGFIGIFIASEFLKQDKEYIWDSRPVYRFCGFLRAVANTAGIISHVRRMERRTFPSRPEESPASARQVQTAHGCPGDCLSGDLHAAPLRKYLHHLGMQFNLLTELF